jgi:hypothetical protein
VDPVALKNVENGWKPVYHKFYLKRPAFVLGVVQVKLLLVSHP